MSIKKCETDLISTTRLKYIMLSVETFKSSVVRVRDILRGCAITGMDSMRHICLYMLSRYITVDKARSLNVPEKFAWENMMEMVRTKNSGVQFALDYFYHPEADCLVNHFDRLFGTDKFSFDMKNIQKHKEILEIMDAVQMDDVDCQIDILGWVYEQHLKTGSSAARDLGQFFTDRSICEYMVKLCNPKFKSNGVPETICDPSMGTGGFLTACMKYFKRKYADTPIDWIVQQKEIHGCDNDPKVAGVARLNMFMESHGARFTNILTHDSLHGDLPQTTYDIILANMPFGLKGLKHVDCCERIKDLKIRGTKSEPLFLQLMMVSLKMGGRCAVVVPDGMLVNTSALHNETRKHLLDNFDVKRVIKMKGQFFMNTGIQPSIIYFEKTGECTKEVDFWEVVKNNNGDIEESLVVSVPREKLDGACSFDMRRYVEQEKPLVNPSSYEIVKISDVCELKSGKGNYDKDGDSYPYYDSNGITGTRKDFLFDGDFVITARKMSIGSVHYVSGKFWASDNTINICVKNDAILNLRYLYFWLLLNNHKLKALSSGVKPGIRKSDVAEIQMPLPPIETQQEIVATLDRIYQPGTTELADTIKMADKAMDLVLANPSGASMDPIVEAQRLVRKSAQMVADVKAQMVAIVKASTCNKNYKQLKLCDVAVCNPDTVSKTDSFDRIQYIDLASVKEGSIANIQSIQYDTKPSRAQRKVKVNDIIWGSVRPLSRSYAFISKECDNTIVSTGFVVVRCKNNAIVIPKFLYYVLTTDDCINYLNNHSTGSTYPAFNVSTLMNYEVNIPPVEFQQSIIDRLDILDSQIKSLQSLSKNAEDNARFILDSYLSN